MEEEFRTPQLERRAPLPALTSLRFFAAIVVVLSHAAETFPLPPLLPFFNAAYSAVTFFFVLSGFVLTYAYIHTADGKMSASIPRFWLARFARLAPSFYVAIAVIAPFLLYGFAVAGTIGAARFWTTITAAATFLPALFIPNVVAWNPPSWSLAVEVCLYASFPWLVRSCFRWSLASTAALATTVLLVSCALRYTLIWHNESLTDFIYHFPLFYFPHFALGIIAARCFLFDRKPGAAARSAMFAFGAIGIVATGAAGPNWETYADVVFVPLAILLIIGGTATWPARLLGSRPLIILGEASYAIYILHDPLRIWFAQVLKRLPQIGPVPTCAIYLGVVILASLATFYLVEHPARRILRGKSTDKLGCKTVTIGP